MIRLATAIFVAAFLAPVGAFMPAPGALRMHSRVVQRVTKGTMLRAALPKNEYGDNLGPAEKAQRSLNRDAGLGRAESVGNTHARLIELRYV